MLAVIEHERARVTPLAAHTAMPTATTLLVAFDTGEGSGPPLTVPEVAGTLAVVHRRQWQAENDCRGPAATVELIAATKQLIDSLNHRRVELVESVDRWAAQHVPQSAGATLHTETLGSVIDRLAIASVRAANLAVQGEVERAYLACEQLFELGTAYDSLLDDVRAGRRRVPSWRMLKTYRAAS